MEEHKIEFQPFIEDDQTIDDYIKINERRYGMGR